MTIASASSPHTVSVMRNYLRAKDENRPFFMSRAFASDASLKMKLRTAAIAFPPHAHGRDAITETLVRTFGQTYENVYTFYLGHPGEEAVLEDYACDWFVAMTEKASGRVRIGCGRYDWTFQRDPHLATSLVITIETMLDLPADNAPSVFGWITTLPYPWTDSARVVQTAPPIEAMAPVMHWLRRDHVTDPSDSTA